MKKNKLKKEIEEERERNRERNKEILFTIYATFNGTKKEIDEFFEWNQHLKLKRDLKKYKIIPYHFQYGWKKIKNNNS